MARNLKCQCCDTPLSGRLDTFGPVDAELCQGCYLALVQECPLPDECPTCHKHALYEKIDAGYPGLYHCTNCGAWVDNIHDET